MMSAFFEFSSISLQEVRVQDREKLAAAAKQAANNIEKAMTEYNYSRPDGYLFLGYALMHQSNYQGAVRNINTYLAKVKEIENRLSSLAAKCDYGFNHLIADGYDSLGSVYLQESSFEANNQRKAELLNESIESFKQAIKLKEDYAIAYSSLGLIYSLQEKYEEAIEQYKKAILFQTEESYRANDYRSIGLAYHNMKRYDEAIENLREAIRLKPNDPLAYEALAGIYVGQGNLEETFKLLKKADEVRTAPPTNPTPYYEMGATYVVRFLQKGSEEDFNEAVKWLKKAVEIRANYASAYYALGTIYWRHSNTDEAIANYEKGIKYDPKNAANYLGLAQVYFELKHNDEAAINYYKQAIQIKQDYAEAYWRLGLVYHHKHDDAEAIKQILEAIKYDPKYLRAYFDLAYIYKDQKNYPEAIKYLNEAMKLAPTNFQPYKEMAKVYEAQGKNEDAIHYYEEAINLLDANDSSTNNLYLGRLKRLRGHCTEAIAYVQTAKLPDEPGHRSC